MKKFFILISILWLGLFLVSFESYNFSADALWKIEQQRREHVYVFPFVGRFIHNKGSYFSYKVFENYLAYYSPSTFFCCNQPLLLEVLSLVIFNGGIFILLKTRSKLSQAVISWILIYPLFVSLTFNTPTFLLLLPQLVPLFGSLVYYLSPYLFNVS